MATTRILVVDDEEDLCEILKFNLEIDSEFLVLQEVECFVDD